MFTLLSGHLSLGLKIISYDWSEPTHGDILYVWSCDWKKTWQKFILIKYVFLFSYKRRRWHLMTITWNSVKQGREKCKEKFERLQNSTGLQGLCLKYFREHTVKDNKLQKQSMVLVLNLDYMNTSQVVSSSNWATTTTNKLPHFLFFFFLQRIYARIRIQMVLLGHNIKSWHLE